MKKHKWLSILMVLLFGFTFLIAAQDTDKEKQEKTVKDKIHVKIEGLEELEKLDVHLEGLEKLEEAMEKLEIRLENIYVDIDLEGLEEKLGSLKCLEELKELEKLKDIRVDLECLEALEALKYLDFDFDFDFDFDWDWDDHFKKDKKEDKKTTKKK